MFPVETFRDRLLEHLVDKTGERVKKTVRDVDGSFHTMPYVRLENTVLLKTGNTTRRVYEIEQQINVFDDNRVNNRASEITSNVSDAVDSDPISLDGWVMTWTILDDVTRTRYVGDEEEVQQGIVEFRINAHKEKSQ